MDEAHHDKDAPSPGKARPTRNFRRSYKACKLCRRKKIRCITDGPGKSCLRCKRELRECVFPVERSYQGDGDDQVIRIPCDLTASTSSDAGE
ncbi:hypothetical protein CSOJ01_05130 [Colletotrichum sojae]|uniref:Zn(2)-C6 fungal-type domain-containing protein n=1 Tax=Colletotrichum sojae TaxID=2175907 RepID=A0A8H6JG07_9PEZI|nr:hypothetical protein CSOJ01_05130 [Colletotrichum sojae]